MGAGSPRPLRSLALQGFNRFMQALIGLAIGEPLPALISECHVVSLLSAARVTGRLFLSRGFPLDNVSIIYLHVDIN